MNTIVEPAIKSLCEQIHSEVSVLNFPYVSDQKQYGTPDYWDRISRAKKGDCEDYVLEMKWRLFEAGMDEEELRIGICTTETGQDHAVLVVADNAHDCDYVLDQRQPRVMNPQELVTLGYKGIMIQRPGRFLWQRWKI